MFRVMVKKGIKKGFNNVKKAYGEWTQMPIPMLLENILNNENSKSRWRKLYKNLDGARIILSMDQTPHGDLKHLSISRRDRHPTWDEIVNAKIRFFGEDTDCMMVIPKKADYVNIEEHCFHVWETPKEWGIQ
jgi:hypothetical protein